MNCYIDIGGTNIRIAIYDNSMEIRKVVFNNNANSFFKIKAILEKFLIKFKINKIVVGMSGTADYAKSIMLNPPNLLSLWGSKFKESFIWNNKSKKIYFENDPYLMTIANHNLLSNNKKDITQFLTISTGIGASLIINNSIYKVFSILA